MENKPTPEQVAEWREAAARIYLDDDNVRCEDIELEHYISGYIYAMTEQAAEIERLKAQLVELMPLDRFTHPPAPKLLTADDVTDEMHQKWNKIFNDPDYIPKDGEIIAAAVNAYNGLTLEASK